MPFEQPAVAHSPAGSASSPTISVAMCTFNGERFLEEQLQSIQHQTQSPDELVVCDDGSTDSTRVILERFAQVAPFPVTLRFNASNLGVTRNFEQALVLCRGDYLALCDQDDRWHPDKLKTLAGLLASNPAAGFACSNAALIDEQGGLRSGTLWNRWRVNPSTQCSESPTTRRRRMLRANCVTGATMLVRGDLLRTHALPMPASWVHDHWIVLLCEMLQRPGCTTPELLTQYRLHDAQVLGLRRQRRLSGPANAAARERTLSKNLERYQDLRSFLECHASSQIKPVDEWLDLVRIATAELIQHHQSQDRPWWQRGLSRLWWQRGLSRLWNRKRSA